jgi:protein phosphatase PTC7
VLLRRGAVHHYSTPQTHAFNTPFQLSIIPPLLRAQAAVFGGMHFEDLPRDAAISSVHMLHGDVLVLATDGVFDNLNNQDILKIVSTRMHTTSAWTETDAGAIGISPHLENLTSDRRTESSSQSTSSPTSPSPNLQTLLATSIVAGAKRASLDMRRDGPFAKEAQRHFPSEWYRGGKVDDITVLVVMAVEEAV